MADKGINFGLVPLGEHDGDWFRVMSNVSNSSLRVKAASVIGYFVRRRKEEYRLIIQYTANKYGLSFDECFDKLRRGDDLGTPLEHFSPDPKIESAIDEINDDIQ